MNSRFSHVWQPGRGRVAAILACSLLHTSKESNVRRSLSFAPTRNLIASVASIDPIRFTALFRIPAVSQVSIVPSGGAGNTQARQAVSPGITFMVTAYEATAAA